MFNAVGNTIANLAGPGTSTLAGSPLPAWAASPYGQCLGFASGGYAPSVVPAGVLDFLPATGTFTVAFRVKLNAFNADAGGGILACDGATGTTGVSAWYENRSAASSPAQYKCAIGVGTAGTFGLLCTTAVGSIADNDWHHVAFSASGTAIAGYLDGRPSTGTATVSGTHSATLSSLPDIGRLNSNALLLNGQIEHIMVWDRALASDEIASVVANPYRVFLPRFGWLVPPTPTATGGGAVTLAGLSAAGAGTFAAAGLGSVALAGLSAAGIGTFTSVVIAAPPPYIDPFGATARPAVDPFSATSRLKGS